MTSSSWNRMPGTSIIAPIFSRSGMTWPKRVRCLYSRLIRSRARCSSDTSVTIGNMTRNSRPAAALSSARSWVRIRPGRSSARRSAR